MTKCFNDFRYWEVYLPLCAILIEWIVAVSNVEWGADTLSYNYWQLLFFSINEK